MEVGKTRFFSSVPSGLLTLGVGRFLLTSRIPLEVQLIDSGGRCSLVVKVSDHGWRVTSLSLVPLKTHSVEEGAMHVKSVNTQTPTRWCGSKERGGCQLRCRSRHLIMAENYEAVAKRPLVAE
ncbi:hypothetical protein TNCV_958551 [Trichonephila clavipes]|nr:hypothetical protein TNCV_958551 [Trichonephila clavipes]